MDSLAHAGQDRKSGKAETGLPGQNSQNRASGTGPRKDGQNITART
jgi:hypothetical protein